MNSKEKKVNLEKEAEEIKEVLDEIRCITEKYRKRVFSEFGETEGVKLYNKVLKMIAEASISMNLIHLKDEDEEDYFKSLITNTMESAYPLKYVTNGKHNLPKDNNRIKDFLKRFFKNKN